MDEAELVEYCRSNGLYVDQIAVWKQVCIQANPTDKKQAKQLKTSSLKEVFLLVSM